MFQDLRISTKLWLLIGGSAFGFVLIGLILFVQVSSIHQEYAKSQKLSQEQSYLKSIMVGGLLVNSATGVYYIDATQKKALKTIQSGIDSVQLYGQKVKTTNAEFFQSIEQKQKNFVQAVEKNLQKAKNQQELSLQDNKRVLKNWRPLKFEIIPRLSTIEKEVQASTKYFNSLLQDLLYKVVITIVIIVGLVGLSNMFISGGIRKKLHALKSGIQTLAHTNDISQKVHIKSQDELGEIADSFNAYLYNLEEGLKEDKRVIDECSQVIEKVNAGFFNTTIVSTAKNPSVEHLKNELNAMIVKTDENLGVLTKILVEFGNAKFDTNIENIQGIGGKIGSLLASIRGTGNSVSEILALVDNANERLLQSASQLKDSSSSLSESSNEQAASLEQTAASLEQITANIRSNTHNASKMASYAKDVSSSAKNGQNLSNETDHAMDEINEKVGAINESITIIDQIAFQTNILSLNAAVEAATAGESGKGFGVVAGEVRNLANRSAEAAKEIKALVEEASVKANEGKEVAYQMTLGYEKLYENIDGTMTLIDAVTKASKEQQTGIEQINDTVSNLDTMTQANANVANNISDMAHNNEDLAKGLQKAVRRTKFKKVSKKRVCDIDMMFDVAKLKLDHIIFKDESIAQAQKGNYFKVTNEHTCALGKWLEKQSHLPFAKTQEWEQLHKYHEKVHQNTQIVVDEFAKGASNSEIFRTSDELEHSIASVFEYMNHIRELNCQDKSASKSHSAVEPAPANKQPKQQQQSPKISHTQEQSSALDDEWESF